MSKQLAEALEKKKGDRSLRALARDLDVAVGTAEGWLNGWRSPEIKHIARLAGYLTMDPCLILEWELIEKGELDNPRYVKCELPLPWVDSPIDIDAELESLVA